MSRRGYYLLVGVILIETGYFWFMGSPVILSLRTIEIRENIDFLRDCKNTLNRMFRFWMSYNLTGKMGSGSMHADESEKGDLDMTEMHEHIKKMEIGRTIVSYCNLRAMFKKVIGIIEASAAFETAYHGVQITSKDDVSFSLLFFDRVPVVARFTGVMDGDKTPFGKIAFEQDGKQCRTYFFNEQEQLYDDFGRLLKAKVLSAALVDTLLDEVATRLIEEGTAFETFSFHK
jgi:hypothetical protein